MAGRTPKPADRRQGHYEGRALTVVEGGKTECPEPPKGILKATREAWATFWDSPVAQAVDARSDAGRLERWIRAVDEYKRVERVFRRKRLVEGSMGQPVLNPLAAYLRDLETKIQKAEEAFGMTPLSRLKLGIAVGQAKLTAEALNRALNKGSDDDGDKDAIEAEWEAV